MADKSRTSTAPQFGDAPTAPPETAAEMLAAAPIEEGEAPLGRLIIRWCLRASVAGALASILIHMVLALIAASVLLDRSPGRLASRPLDIEMAVLSDIELTDLREQALREDPVPFDAADLQDLETTPDIDFDSPVTDVALAPLDIGDVSPFSGAATGVGEDADLGGAAGASANFFGVEAQGRRFAFIVDVSGSMHGERIETLRKELTTSIDGLTEGAQFAIFFFSSDSTPLGGGVRWLIANDRNRAWARREIRAVPARGGTMPVPAFEHAFALQPRPDAIYFMTDGIFHSSAVPVIAELNESSDALVPVHCIAFMNDSARDLLGLIARQSGGSYTHISGPRH
ncbi:MAG: VWA domain-containing protein [Phycisphaeraceae bacterium]|nr:MAG: VWA domain-containing protein [Phycisphaeraceae bacterium]